jgi:N-acetylmuramoyl-L-alanine amidase
VSFLPDFPGAAVLPSPNHDERRPGSPVDILLLHYTGMETAHAALDRLRDPTGKVSCHYFLFEDGRVAQLVPETLRAWHAGMSFWAGETDVNSRSVGIEIVNPGHDYGYRNFPDRQIEALIPLCRAIMGRRGIRPERLLAHSDVAPSRKRDPGELFPWARLAQHGVGVWPSPVPIVPGPVLAPGDQGAAVVALKADLARFGYRVPLGACFEAETRHVVAAFQRHFRPERVDGLADRSTVRTLRRLVAAISPAA